MDCKEVEGLITSYALGALEPSEREQVEAHLATCPRCSLIYEEDREITALLSQSVPQEDPPASVREGLLSRIDTLPVPDKQEARREPASPHLPFGTMRRLSSLYLAAAVAVIAVLGAVGTGIWFDHRLDQLVQENNKLAVTMAQESNRLAGNLTRETNHLSAMVSQLDEKSRQNTDNLAQQNSWLLDIVQEQRSLTYLSATPGIVVYLLRPLETTSRASGMLMVSSKGTYAILAALRLDVLPPGKIYQVWMIRDGQRDSVGFLTVDSTGYGQISIWPDKPLLEYKQVDVTIEPERGSESPSGEKILGGRM